MSERIIQFYGGQAGSCDEQLSHPRQLAIDRYGNVLVADTSNNRIVLLSCSFTDLGYIPVPGLEVKDPSALFVDQLNHRPYIVEGTTECVFILIVGNVILICNVILHNK